MTLLVGPFLRHPRIRHGRDSKAGKRKAREKTGSYKLGQLALSLEVGGKAFTWVGKERLAGSPANAIQLHLSTECSSKSYNQAVSDEDGVQVRGCARHKAKATLSGRLPSFYR